MRSLRHLVPMQSNLPHSEWLSDLMTLLIRFPQALLNVLFEEYDHQNAGA